MIHEEIADFARALAPGTALAGLDYGDRTIGVAVSDTLRQVATPLETIRRRKFSRDAAALGEILAKRRIGGLVLGLPRNMDGSEGPRCQSTRAFARNLDRRLGQDPGPTAGPASGQTPDQTPGQAAGLPITFWDERLSTVAAERALLEADASRARRTQVIDHVAAAYILQGALDRMRSL